MKNYKVTVRTKGKMLIINGTMTRTPSVFYIDESDINNFKQKFNLQGINDYKIEPLEKVEPRSIRIITNSKQEEQKYEEEEKPKTLLESYLDD